MGDKAAIDRRDDLKLPLEERLAKYQSIAVALSAGGDLDLLTPAAEAPAFAEDTPGVYVVNELSYYSDDLTSATQYKVEQGDDVFDIAYRLDDKELLQAAIAGEINTGVDLSVENRIQKYETYQSNDPYSDTFITAIKTNDGMAVAQMINDGMAVAQMINDGQNPDHSHWKSHIETDALSAAIGNNESLKAMLEAGADANYEVSNNDWEWTPVGWAVEWGEIESAKLLQEHGGKFPDHLANHIMFHQLGGNNLETVKFMIEEGHFELNSQQEQSTAGYLNQETRRIMNRNEAMASEDMVAAAAAYSDSPEIIAYLIDEKDQIATERAMVEAVLHGNTKSLDALADREGTLSVETATKLFEKVADMAPSFGGNDDPHVALTNAQRNAQSYKTIKLSMLDDEAQALDTAMEAKGLLSQFEPSVEKENATEATVTNNNNLEKDGQDTGQAQG